MIDKPPQEWTFADIDACVIDGNAYFIEHCKERNMRPQMLLANELPQSITIGNHMFVCFQSDDKIETGILGFNEAEAEHSINTLTDAMIRSFAASDSCLLFCGGLTVAIVQRESMWFVFDPHSRGNDGLLNPDGSAVLVSFSCIRKTNLFLERLFTQSLGLSLLTQFELVSLNISKALAFCFLASQISLIIRVLSLFFKVLAILILVFAS